MLAGTAGQKVNNLTTLTYNLASKRFGLEENKVTFEGRNSDTYHAKHEKRARADEGTALGT